MSIHECLHSISGMCIVVFLLIVSESLPHSNVRGDSISQLLLIRIRNALTRNNNETKKDQK